MKHAELADIVLTTEAARIAGVCAPTIRNWEKTGRLPAMKTGNGTRLFRRSDLEQLARERENSRGRKTT